MKLVLFLLGCLLSQIALSEHWITPWQLVIGSAIAIVALELCKFLVLRRLSAIADVERAENENQ